MKLSTYKDSLLFGLTQVTNYRSDIWLTIFNRGISLAGVIVLWHFINQSNPGSTGLTALVPYFLIANGIQGLTDAEGGRFTRILNDEIKLGTLNNHLLRPIDPVLFLYFSFLGTRGVVMLMGTLLTLAGFLLLPRITVIQFLFFLFTLGIAFIIGFIFNLLVGSLSFWTPEARHLQNVAAHVVRVFGGILIPISFFSPQIKNILLLSPLPAIAYTPAIIVQSSLSREVILPIFASLIWIILLLPFSSWVWNKGLKHYEAVGI